MKTLRRKSIVALFIALVACLTMVFALSFRTASADVVEPDKDLFTMEEGASVALTQDGLRFRVKMGENVYAKIVTEDTDKEVSLSVLVAPKTLFDAVSDGAYLNLSKSVKIEIEDEAKIYLYDGYYWANAVLTNLNADNNAAITESQFDLSFAAIGVIEQDGTAPVYATFAGNDIANNTRNQYDVITDAVLDVEDAEQATALLDSESPYASWFGGEDYPIVIDTVEKYNALTAQITNGVNFTANIEVQNKFDIPEDNTVELPATAKKIHYVSFYNDSELLETVEVVDGESAVCSKTVPAYKSLEAMNGGYVRGYKNGGWVANDGSALDLSAVYANVEAKVNWVWGDHSAVLREDALREEPNTVFNWDREVGVTQVEGRGTTFTRSFDTTVKLAGQRGSTKIEITDDTSSDLKIGYNFGNYQFSADQYVVMDIYADFPETVYNVWLRFAGVHAGATIMNKTWATVIIPTATISANTYFWFIPRSETAAGVKTSGVLYFSKAIVVDSSAITYPGTDSVYTLGSGDVELKGSPNHYYWIDTANDAIFTQPFVSGTAAVYNNSLYYCDHNSNDRDAGLWIYFNKAYTGKIYFTVRGFAADSVKATDAQIFDADGGHKGTPKAVYVGDAADGYKVYSLDFGTEQITKIKLRTYGYMNQVHIASISTTNPLA